MSLSEVAVVSMAVFAATYLLRYFDGPFHVLRRFRERCGIVYVPVLDNDGNEVDIIEDVSISNLAEFVGCHWCLTVWVSALFYAIYTFVRSMGFLWWIVLTLFGVSVSGFVHDYIRHMHHDYD